MDEVEAVQGRVNSVIQQGLPVQCQVVPLSAAMKINGLRAMFGETYPDPVRLVCVGPSSVESVLDDPVAARWRDYSIEFCGGTHVQNTRDAVAFAITGYIRCIIRHRCLFIVRSSDILTLHRGDGCC